MKRTEIQAYSKMKVIHAYEVQAAYSVSAMTFAFTTLIRQST